MIEQASKDGFANVGAIKQLTGKNRSQINQQGALNYATVDQFGAHDNKAIIRQGIDRLGGTPSTGNTEVGSALNFAGVKQTGRENEATVNQHGFANFAGANFDSARSLGLSVIFPVIPEIGDSAVHQFGNNNVTAINQYGSFNKVRSIQRGSDNSISILQKSTASGGFSGLFD